MNTERLPWEIVETFPSTDAALLAHWDQAVGAAGDHRELARSLIGRALCLYWATQERVVDESWAQVAQRRSSDLDRALELARSADDVNLLAEALLGVLYGTWGPDRHLERESVVDALSQLRPDITDEELRLRTMEWEVLQHFDTADLDAARRAIDNFAHASAGSGLLLFTRREMLWRGCLAMLEGAIDQSLQINAQAISSTANVAGSPFSFQNVAITLAIERYLRRGLGDTVEAIRSIRASSPRVGANWDTGLAFALSEIGELDEARELFETLAAHQFGSVPRDLNWLVTMQLLGLIALTIDADEHGPVLIDLLQPFAHLDGTHGSGYASYGPVGRVLGSLLARWGNPDEAERVFADVLATRSCGPWTALTLHDRAVARQTRRPGEALADATLAESELRHYGLDAWAGSARAVADELLSKGYGGAVAILRDGTWTLRHDAGVAVVSPSIGIDHLTTLLRRAGDIVDVSDLERSGDVSIAHSASAESSLDPTARSQYRRRLAQLENRRDVDEALQFEIEFLRRELGGAVFVVSNSAELERLRVRVTKAIHRAIDQIANTSPSLATHLRDSVRTGRTCSYQPVGGRSWVIIRR